MVPIAQISCVCIMLFKNISRPILKYGLAKIFFLPTECKVFLIILIKISENFVCPTLYGYQSEVARPLGTPSGHPPQPVFVPRSYMAS